MQGTPSNGLGGNTADDIDPEAEYPREPVPDVEIVGQFALVPDWVLLSSLSSTAKMVYAIYALQGYKGRASHRPKKRTAALIGVSVTTLERALRELRDFGAIEVVPRYVAESIEGGRRQTTNAYRVMMNPPQDAAAATPLSKSADPPPGTDADPSIKRVTTDSRATSNEVALAPTAPAAPPTTKIDGQNLPWNALRDATGAGTEGAMATSIPSALHGTHKEPGIRELAWREISARPGPAAWRAEHPEYLERAIADLIHERAAQYRQVFRDAVLTPKALQKWWIDLPHMRRLGRDPGALDVARIAADETRRMREGT